MRYFLKYCQKGVLDCYQQVLCRSDDDECDITGDTRSQFVVYVHILSCAVCFAIHRRIFPLEVVRMTSVRIDWGSQSAVTGRIDLGGPRHASRREYRLSPLYSLPALPAVKVPCDHSHLGFLERSAFLQNKFIIQLYVTCVHHPLYQY